MGYTAPELRRIAELVDAETRRLGLLTVRERVERDIEQGVRVVRDPRDVNLHGGSAVSANGSSPLLVEATGGPVYAEFSCRTEGCENRANAKYDRGPYYRLCYEACIPARREEISAKAVESRANGRVPADPDPPPREASFADLKRSRRFLDAAEDAYQEAADALLEHPLGRALLEIAETRT